MAVFHNKNLDIFWLNGDKPLASYSSYTFILHLSTQNFYSINTAKFKHKMLGDLKYFWTNLYLLH